MHRRAWVRCQCFWAHHGRDPRTALPPRHNGANQHTHIHTHPHPHTHIHTHTQKQTLLHPHTLNTWGIENVKGRTQGKHGVLDKYARLHSCSWGECARARCTRCGHGAVQSNARLYRSTRSPSSSGRRHPNADVVDPHPHVAATTSGHCALRAQRQPLVTWPAHVSSVHPCKLPWTILLEQYDVLVRRVLVEGIPRVRG